jgi:hypothetical protein
MVFSAVFLSPALLALALADPPESKTPPSKEELAAIAERGRQLAAYDDAAWKASDIVKARKPKGGSVVRYIARQTDGGWEVAFGRLDEGGDAFLIAYLLTPGKEAGSFAVEEYDPPRADTGFYRGAARSIDTALGDFIAHFEGEQRPYNVAVLAAPESRFWLYLVPAPTKPGVWPIGGDVRYLMSPDGAHIVRKRTLHKAIIEKELPPKDQDSRAVMGMHSHVLDIVPEDTDVFHVLVRKPKVPELVVTDAFAYQVDVRGEITLLGKTENLLKKKPPATPD